MQIDGRIAAPLRPSRRERFTSWVRRSYPTGAKAYAQALGVDVRTARSRWDGAYPPPDEEDRLIAIHGDAFLGPVIFPALAAWVQRQEVAAREAQARLELARARLARAHRHLGGENDNNPHPPD